MITRLVSLLTAVCLLSAATPAHATEGPKYEESRVYTQCTGPSRVWNVNAAVYDQRTANWFTGRPLTSLDDGGGCGVIDPIGLQDEDPFEGGVFDMIWAGTFTGNMRTIVVHADVMGQLKLDGLEIGLQLLINGKDVALADSTPVRLTPSADGQTTRLEFAFTDLALTDFGDNKGHTKRNVRLRLHAVDPRTPTIQWVWGASDALAGLTFNEHVGDLPSVSTDTRRVKLDDR